MLQSRRKSSGARHTCASVSGGGLAQVLQERRVNSHVVGPLLELEPADVLAAVGGLDHRQEIRDRRTHRRVRVDPDLMLERLVGHTSCVARCTDRKTPICSSFLRVGRVGSHARTVLEAANHGAPVIPLGLSRLADPDASHVVTRCAHCSASLDGTLGAGRQWFAEHRLQAHPELAEPAPRRVRWRRRAASVDHRL